VSEIKRSIHVTSRPYGIAYVASTATSAVGRPSQGSPIRMALGKLTGLNQSKHHLLQKQADYPELSLQSTRIAYIFLPRSTTLPQVVYSGFAHRQASDPFYTRNPWCGRARVRKMPRREHIALVACGPCRTRKSRVRLVCEYSKDIYGKAHTE
jgi:hypothetical protein